MGVFDREDKEILNFLQNTQLQQKNRFKFVIFAFPFSLIGAASVIGDAAVSTFYLRSVTLPLLNNFETAPVNENKYVTRILPPDDVTMSFFEDEQATVARYFKMWEELIQTPVGFGTTTLGLPRKNTEFRDDQESGKKTGLLLLQNSDGKVSKFPRIMLYGLMYKSADTITIGHQETDNLILNVTFSVDEIAFPLLF